MKLGLCSRFSSHPAAHASLRRSPVLYLTMCCPTLTWFQYRKQKPHEKRKRATNQVLAQLNDSISTRKICSSQLDDGGYKDSRGPRRKETDKSNAKVRCLFKATYLMHLGEFKCASFHNAPSVSGRQGEKRRVEEWRPRPGPTTALCFEKVGPSALSLAQEQTQLGFFGSIQTSSFILTT